MIVSRAPHVHGPPAKTQIDLWILAAGSYSHTALLSQALLANESTTVFPGPIELSHNYRRARVRVSAVGAHTAHVGLEMTEDP